MEDITRNSSGNMDMLAEVYGEYTKEELQMIAKLHHMKGYSRWRKGEMAENVKNYILSPEEMRKYFLCMNEEEIQKFETVSESMERLQEGYDGSFDYLLAGGYCAVCEDMTVFVPEDVREAYKKINTVEFRKKRSRINLLGDYCHAANNLYAVTPKEVMTEFFNRYEQPETREEEIMHMYEVLRRYRCDFEYREGLFIDLGLIKGEKYKDLYERQQNSPFYYPTKDEVEKLARYDQTEITKELARVMQYLQKVLHAEIEVIAEACSVIQIVIRKGGSLENILEILDEYKILFQDEEQIQDIMPLLVDLWNHSRMVLNRGYTPAEMQEIEKEQVVLT